MVHCLLQRVTQNSNGIFAQPFVRSESDGLEPPSQAHDEANKIFYVCVIS